MTVGLYFKYSLGDSTYVKLLGMPHGLLFVAYIILAFLIKIRGRIIKADDQWKVKDFGIILIASILPFGTFYIDWKYLRK